MIQTREEIIELVKNTFNLKEKDFSVNRIVKRFIAEETQMYLSGKIYYYGKVINGQALAGVKAIVKLNIEGKPDAGCPLPIDFDIELLWMGIPLENPFVTPEMLFNGLLIRTDVPDMTYQLVVDGWEILLFERPE